MPINGARAYALMLNLAQKRTNLSVEMIQDIHRAVVGADSPVAGEIRKERVSIRGSLHVPPNYMRVPSLVDEMIARYREDSAERASIRSTMATAEPQGSCKISNSSVKVIAPILIGPQERRNTSPFSTASKLQFQDLETRKRFSPSWPH